MLFRGFSIDNERQNSRSTGTWHFGTNSIPTPYSDFLGINAAFIFNPPILWPMLSTWLFRLFSVVPSNRKITVDKDHAIRVTKDDPITRPNSISESRRKRHSKDAFENRFQRWRRRWEEYTDTGVHYERNNNITNSSVSYTFPHENFRQTWYFCSVLTASLTCQNLSWRDRKTAIAFTAVRRPSWFDVRRRA